MSYYDDNVFAGWSEDDSEYRLREQEWENHLLAKELKWRERLWEHRPLGAARVRSRTGTSARRGGGVAAAPKENKAA